MWEICKILGFELKFCSVLRECFALVYGYNVGDSNLQLNWQTAGKNFKEIIKPGDTFYIKPFVPHNFRGKGKILILRLAGKVVGESQRELSFIGKEKVERAISETIQWFDPKGKN